MDTSSTTGSDEMIFLHDDEGNAYLVRRSTVKNAQVPPELKAEVENFAKGETSGYGPDTGKMAMSYFGVGKSDKDWAYAQKYDQNGNGVIDWPDVKYWTLDQFTMGKGLCKWIPL
jgi:hypothetical protein